MTTYTGTAADESITPFLVSGTVSPSFPAPTDQNDSLLGNGGDDTLDGGLGVDSLYGGAGNDRLMGDHGGGVLDGGGGIDTLDTTLWFDNYDVNLATGVTSRAGEVVLRIENVTAGQGNDSLTGNAAANVLQGGGGNDTLVGAGGNDSLFGDNGHDLIRVGLDIDLAEGGDGTDTLDTSAWDADYSIDLATGLTSRVGESFLGFENLIAGDGNDHITGTASDNVLQGGAGNDTIDGAGGADSNYGGSGDDEIHMGFGLAFADGGADVDTVDTSAHDLDALVNLTTGQGLMGSTYQNFENLVMGDGNDTLIGTIGANLLSGGAGDDSIENRDGADTIYGGDGNDTLRANIRIGMDDCVADGGDGTDLLDLRLYLGSMTLNMATGLADSGGESFLNFENVLTGPGDSNITGTSGINVIHGGLGNDTIIGGGGADSLFGGGGADYIAVTSESVQVDGGNYIDTLDTTAWTSGMLLNLGTGATNVAGKIFTGFEHLVAGDGNDTVFGTGYDNVLYGGGGNDRLQGMLGDDSNYGGGGDDLIFAVVGIDFADGGAGFDTLETSSMTGDYVINLSTGLTNIIGESFLNFEAILASIGNDSLVGTSGANRIEGNGGRDTIDGAGGADSLYGGLHDDYLLLRGDTALVDGGDGVDTLDTTAVTTGIAIDLQAGTMGGVTDSAVDFENLIAGNGADTLTGSVLANEIQGGGGGDRIDGGSGADTLIGGGGLDRLTGSAGTDRLIGGTGADRFIFAKAAHSSPAASDTLAGDLSAPAFEGAGVAGGDIIDLSGIDADTTTAGNQAFTFGSIAKGGLSLVNLGDLTILRGNIDGDAGFELRIVIEDGAVLAATYAAGDFIL